MGPPGSKRKEHALSLAEYYSYTCISVGDLLNKEISKKSEYGKSVVESRKEYSYSKCIYLYYVVSDDIVNELVSKQIE
jgi:adenylate kinase